MHRDLDWTEKQEQKSYIDHGDDKSGRSIYISFSFRIRFLNTEWNKYGGRVLYFALLDINLFVFLFVSCSLHIFHTVIRAEVALSTLSLPYFVTFFAFEWCILATCNNEK